MRANICNQSKVLRHKSTAQKYKTRVEAQKVTNPFAHKTGILIKVVKRFKITGPLGQCYKQFTTVIYDRSKASLLGYQH